MVSMTARGLALWAFIALLTACSSKPTRLPPPDLRLPQGMENSAVDNLTQGAERKAALSDWEGASSLLERALRIEPQNPWIWQRLAKVRMQQERWREAEHLALRSNAAAVHAPQLMADNWNLIASSREQRGDHNGAQMARNRAKSFEEQK